MGMETAREMTRPSTPRGANVLAWLVLVLVLGAAVRFYHLDAQSTWVDELIRLVWAKGHELHRWFGFLPSETGARLPPRELKHALPVVSAHNPPLYSILLNTWIRAVGSESDFAARVPSALLGVLSIVGTFLAARQLLGPRVGAWTAALVALSPFHVFHAQEVNHYALAACLIAFSYWFYFRWLERPGVASGVGLALTGLAALYTHYYAAIVLAFQAVELILRHRTQPRQLVLTSLPYLAIAAGFAPYLPMVRIQLREMTHPAMVGLFQGTRYFGERLQAIGVVPWLGERGEYLDPRFGVPIAALGIGLFVVGIRFVADRYVRRVLLLNAVGPVVVVAVLYWVMRSNSILWTRYQLVFTFAQFIPIAVALHHAPRWRWCATPALALLAAIGFRFLFVELVKEDWKGAAAAIASQGSRHEHVVVYRPNLAYSLARYLDSENRLFGVEDGPNLSRLLAAAADRQDAMWFVSAWADGSDLPMSVHAFLSCRYSRRAEFPVHRGRVGMTVTRYWEPRVRGNPTRSPAEHSATVCVAESHAPGTADWERPTPGPEAEAGWIDVPASEEAFEDARSVTVSGWAFSTRGIRTLVFDVDGREALRDRHVGLRRPDVAAAYPAVPETHSLNAGFWGVVDVTSVDAGVHLLVVTAVHADGTTSRIGAREFTLNRSAPQEGPRSP